MIISLIVAVDEKGGIGKNNRLPWHLPSDLRHFKYLTMGHHLVMGRKTYETIGRSLPGRIMVVLTHQTNLLLKDCLVVNSLDKALKLVKDNQEKEVFIIGGGEIFNQAIGLADKIYLTSVHTDVKADVFFPIIDRSKWELTDYVDRIKNEKDEYESDYKIFVRHREKRD